MAPVAPARPSARRWWIASVVLLVIAVGCLVVGVRGNDDALARLPAARSVAPVPVPAAPVVSRSEPVELRIPAIGLTVAVSGLGLNPDRTVQVPTDFQAPGWFRLGPTPGQLGSAVILGHVDSFRGPAVFYRLRELAAGDVVSVALADGRITHFVVTGIAQYPKEQFPAEQVYGSHGSSALQLVTCGGEFDRVTRSYRANVVVYTSLVSTTPAPVAGQSQEGAPAR